MMCDFKTSRLNPINYRGNYSVYSVYIIMRDVDCFHFLGKNAILL